jgi:hypothetical protein
MLKNLMKSFLIYMRDCWSEASLRESYILLNSRSRVVDRGAEGEVPEAALSAYEAAADTFV